MCITYLGFVLLVWFPGVLHAQDATQSCVAPRLDGGFFSPRQDTYSHGTKLTYTCENGHKPIVKGWWATSTCKKGKWSHEPQCIDEKACFAPTIPNANYTKNQVGWYQDRDKIRITCDRGYESKNRDVTAVCTNGAWPSVPVCEKSTLACGEPPQVPHAVIIHQGYQEVFAVDSVVQYKCKDGYTVEGAENKKSIFCIAGDWTDGPTCRPSTTSGLNDRDTKPLLSTIDQCGNPPIVLNGVVEETPRSLRYQCNTFYKLMGPDTVACYSDGTWSEVPTCEVWVCSVNTDENRDLKPVGVIYIRYGETVELECKDEHWFDNFSVARCIDEIPTLSRCCNKAQIKTNTC